MRNLVLTVNINKGGGHQLPLFTTSVSRAKQYALKVGADFICVEDEGAFPGFQPTWQRFALFTDPYKKYDNILYLDSDLILTKFTPNIFDMMMQHDASVFASIDYEHIPARRYTGYFNAGLFALKRSWIDLWDMQEVQVRMSKWKNKSHMDQCCLNEMVKDTCNGYVNLGRCWNTMTSNLETFPIVYGAHYIHYHKTKFDLLRLQQYEQADRETPPQEEFFMFPEWWKEYDFHDILAMEADYNNIQMRHVND